jgi:iron complex outermembrane receptor protein
MRATNVRQAVFAAASMASMPPSRKASDTVIDVVVDAPALHPTEFRNDVTLPAYRLDRAALGRPGVTAASALASVPGVQTTRSGGAADLAGVSIRASRSAQVPIYLAGVRLNDELTGTTDLGSLPMWLLERAEIYRGHAPIGSDQLGIGGAIVFEPRRFREPRVGAALGIGSFGHRDIMGTLAWGGALGARGSAGAMLAVRHGFSRGDYSYLDDGGTLFDARDDVLRRRLNADTETLDVWSLGHLDTRGAKIDLLLGARSRRGGAPGLAALPATRARMEARRLIAGVDVKLACRTAACAWRLKTSALLTGRVLDDPAGELGRAGSIRNDGQRVSAEVSTSRMLSAFARADVGVQQQMSRLRISPGIDGVSAARRSLSRGRVAVTLRVPSLPLWLVSSGAVECHASFGDAGVCSVLAPVGRLGARYDLARQLALQLNLGRYVRVPTLGELYGTSPEVQGNQSLEPESGYSVDAGLSASYRGGVAEAYAQVFGFVRWADELIAYRRSSFGALRPYNAEAARVAGMEVGSGGWYRRRLRLALNLTLLDPRDTSASRHTDSTLLPLQARFVAAPEMELRSGAWRRMGLDYAALTLRYLHRASRVADPAGLIRLGAQNQLDLDVVLSFLAKRIRASVRATNLLAEHDVDLVGAPLPGRAVYAKDRKSVV